MSYKEHGMWEVLEVLRRIHRGEGRRCVARSTNRSRKTVSRYVATAMDMGWVPGLHEPDEVLAAEVLTKLKPGPRDNGPGKAEELLRPHEEQIKSWLKGEISWYSVTQIENSISSIYTFLDRCKQVR